MEEASRFVDAVPAFSEFLGQLVVAFGGPDALAREFHATYQGAKVGSQARVQLMLKLSDLLLRNTQHFGVVAPVEELSDTDMVDVMKSYFEQVQAMTAESNEANNGSSVTNGIAEVA